MFKRKCPNCECDIRYSNKKNKNKAEKNKVMCKKCTSLYKKIETLKKTNKFEKRVFNDKQKEYIISQSSNPEEIKRFVNEINQKKRDKIKKERNILEWERNCPNCGQKITYYKKTSRNIGEKNNSECYACCGKKRSIKMIGENNHFYNKHHSEESKKKIKNSQNNSDKYKKFLHKIKQEEYKKFLSNLVSGEKNPRFGRGSLYDIWLEKYGENEAKKRDEEYKKKISLKSSGENNGMYGKPSPQGSGNGWSGWYKNWFFRSIHELSYMINVIEKENAKWESAETKKYKIQYFNIKGEKRNYFPDFLINDKKIIEIKPERLKKTISVLLKAEAAKEFCEKNNFEFEIVSPKLLTSEEILSLYFNKEIKFTDKYEEKFKKRFNI